MAFFSVRDSRIGSETPLEENPFRAVYVPLLARRAVARWSAVASAHALRTAPRRCRREPRDLVSCATRETSRLASACTPRMVPPSPHAGPGTATPHHGSIWGNNKENAAGVTPGPMAYGTTPGAKTNAESVAEVRRRPDTSVTRVSAPIPRPRARRRPRLDPCVTRVHRRFRDRRDRARDRTPGDERSRRTSPFEPSATRTEKPVPSASADPSRPPPPRLAGRHAPIDRSPNIPKRALERRTTRPSRLRFLRSSRRVRVFANRESSA